MTVAAWRPCGTCGEPCLWSDPPVPTLDGSWVCGDCGDEWTDDDASEYAPPTSDNTASDGSYWSDPTPNEQWEVTSGVDVSEPLPTSAYPT